MLSFSSLHGGYATKIERDDYGSRNSFSHQSQASKSSSRYTSSINEVSSRNSPERSTSAPPELPDTETAAHAAVRYVKPNGHQEEAFEVMQRLGNVSFTPRSASGNLGPTPETYSSGSSGSPSPITRLQAPVAKRMVHLDASSSLGAERPRSIGRNYWGGQCAGSSVKFSNGSLGGSPLSSSGGVSNFDAPFCQKNGIVSGGQSFDLHAEAQYRSRSAQPFSPSSSIERSASFRFGGQNSASRHGDISRPTLLMEFGRSVTFESHHCGDVKISEGNITPASGNRNLYSSAYGFDSKRRGERTRNGHSRNMQSDFFGPPPHDQRLDLLGNSIGLNEQEYLHQRMPLRTQQNISALPPRYELRHSTLARTQEEILDQLIEHQSLSVSHGGRMRGSSRKNKGKNVRKSKGISHGGRKAGAGKNFKGERSKAGSGGKGRRSGHNIEINAIGIGSKLHFRWVEAFGTAKTAHVSLEDVAKRGLTVDLAMDQFGSRFIQQRLEKAPASHKEISFDQILPHILQLCTDVFGNYVIQKLFEYGTMEQKRILAEELRGHVLKLSLQMYGCRVVQKAIDVLNLDQKAELIEELHGHVMKCVRDQNGNHVIQKCIEKIPPSNIQFVVDAFKGQNMKLAMHSYGCRVIQRLLERCSGQQRNCILSEVLESTQSLAKNQYGNYVVQHILVHANPEHRAAVMGSFRGNLVRLSRHKFASNVIEKCVTHATREERKILIDEVLGEKDLDSACLPLMAMAKDQYANYVVQRLIEVADPGQRQYLIQRIKHHLPYLSKVPYGKHIIATIEKAQAGSIF